MGRQSNQSESFAVEYWRHRTELTETGALRGDSKISDKTPRRTTTTQVFRHHFRMRRVVLVPPVEQRDQIIVQLHNYPNYYTENYEILKLYNHCKLAN